MFTPYELVYGKKILLPIEFEIKALRTVVEFNRDILKASRNKFLHLKELDELRKEIWHHT